MIAFRFENIEIRKDGVEISDNLLNIADKEESRRLCRYAEQLSASIISITNNIAEGSGSFSNKEFASFLIILRRLLFESVNILQI